MGSCMRHRVVCEIAGKQFGAAMNEEFKNQLDSTLESHRSRLLEEQCERDAWAAFEDDVNTLFKKKCRTIVIPVYKQFSSYLKTQGWNSTIHIFEDYLIPTKLGWTKHSELATCAMLRFCKGDGDPDKMHNVPYLVLVCDYRNNRIFFHYSTIGAGKKGSRSDCSRMDIADITRNGIRESLVWYFSLLLEAGQEG